MKLRKIAKIFIVFLILILFVNVTQVFAGDYTNPNQFDSYKNPNSPVDRVLHNAFGVALTVMRTITFGWSIFSLIVIAIHMLTTASPFDAIRMKEHHIPTYVVGLVLLFGATGILQLISYFVNDTIGNVANSTP